MPERLAPPSELEAIVAPGGWRLEVLRGTAAELHAEAVAPRRTVRVNLVTGPAVVLGSSQPAPKRTPGSGVDLARRRSGGGAVWLTPGEQLWVDFVLPRADPLWVDDVGRSAEWLGSAWARCVGAPAEVSTPPMLHREAGAVACFAALGPGEVSVLGSKVVGISQRRTRELARFQTVAYLHWDPYDLIEVLQPEEPVVARLRDAVAPIGRGSAAGSDGGEWDVVERLLASVP